MTNNDIPRLVGELKRVADEYQRRGMNTNNHGQKSIYYATEGLLRQASTAFSAANERERVLREGLDESVKLHSHYASLLNDYDDGERMIFVNREHWLARLAALTKAQEGE